MMTSDNSVRSFGELQLCEKEKAEQIEMLHGSLEEWADSLDACCLKYSKYEELMTVAKHSLATLQHDIEQTEMRINHSKKNIEDYKRDRILMTQEGSDRLEQQHFIEDRNIEEVCKSIPEEESKSRAASTGPHQVTTSPMEIDTITTSKTEDMFVLDQKFQNNTIQPLRSIASHAKEEMPLSTATLNPNVKMENSQKINSVKAKPSITKSSKLKSTKERLEELTRQSQRALKKQKAAAESIARVLKDKLPSAKLNANVPSTTQTPLPPSSTTTPSSNTPESIAFIPIPQPMTNVIEGENDLIAILFLLIVRTTIERQQAISIEALELLFKSLTSQSFVMACQTLKLPYSSLSDFTLQYPHRFESIIQSNGVHYVRVCFLSTSESTKCHTTGGNHPLDDIKETVLKGITIQQQLVKDLVSNLPGCGEEYSTLQLLYISSILRYLGILKSPNQILSLSFSTMKEFNELQDEEEWFIDIPLSKHILKVNDKQGENPLPSSISDQSTKVLSYAKPFDFKESILLQLKALRLHPSFTSIHNIPLLSPTFSHKIDPKKHDIFGECNDDECMHQHRRDYLMSPSASLEEFLLYDDKPFLGVRNNLDCEGVARQFCKVMQENAADDPSRLLFLIPKEREATVGNLTTTMPYFSLQDILFLNKVATFVRDLRQDVFEKTNNKQSSLKSVVEPTVEKLNYRSEDYILLGRIEKDAENPESFLMDEDGGGNARYYDSIEERQLEEIESLKKEIVNSPQNLDAHILLTLENIRYYGGRNTIQSTPAIPQKLEMLGKGFEDGLESTMQYDKGLFSMSRSLEVDGNVDKESLWLCYLKMFCINRPGSIEDKLEMVEEAISCLPSSYTVWCYYLRFQKPGMSLSNLIEVYLRPLNVFAEFTKSSSHSNILLDFLLRLLKLITNAGYVKDVLRLLDHLLLGQTSDQESEWHHVAFSTLALVFSQKIRNVLDQMDLDVLWLYRVDVLVFQTLRNHEELHLTHSKFRDLYYFRWRRTDLLQVFHQHSSTSTWWQEVRTTLEKALIHSTSYGSMGYHILLYNQLVFESVFCDETSRGEDPTLLHSQLLLLCEKNELRFLGVPFLIFEFCKVYYANGMDSKAETLMEECLLYNEYHAESVYYFSLCKKNYVGYVYMNNQNLPYDGDSDMSNPNHLEETLLKGLSQYNLFNGQELTYAQIEHMIQLWLEEQKVTDRMQELLNLNGGCKHEMDIFFLLILCGYCSLKYGTSASLKCLEQWVVMNPKFKKISRNDRIRVLMEWIRLKDEVDRNISIVEAVQWITTLLDLAGGLAESNHLHTEKVTKALDDSLASAIVVYLSPPVQFNQQFDCFVWRHVLRRFSSQNQEDILSKLVTSVHSSSQMSLDYAAIALKNKNISKTRSILLKAISHHKQNIQLVQYSIELEMGFNNIEKAMMITREALIHNPLNAYLANKVIELSRYSHIFVPLIKGFQDIHLRWSCLGDDLLMAEDRQLLDQVDECHQVTKVALVHRALPDVPLRVFMLPHLVELNLSLNCIVFLPRSVENLVNLEWLDLSFNSLLEFSPSLCKLTKLRYCNFSYNHITHLPNNVGKLVHLEVMNLHANLLKDLPNSMAKLKLKELRLSCNNFQSFPSGLRNPANKQMKVFLDGNPIFIANPDRKVKIYDSLPACVQCGKGAGNTQSFNGVTLCPNCIVLALAHRIS